VGELGESWQLQSAVAVGREGEKRDKRVKRETVEREREPTVRGTVPTRERDDGKEVL